MVVHQMFVKNMDGDMFTFISSLTFITKKKQTHTLGKRFVCKSKVKLSCIEWNVYII